MMESTVMGKVLFINENQRAAQSSNMATALSTIGASVIRVPDMVRHEIARHRAIKELNKLDNRTLEDVGVPRAHILTAMRRPTARRSGV